MTPPSENQQQFQNSLHTVSITHIITCKWNEIFILLLFLMYLEVLNSTKIDKPKIKKTILQFFINTAIFYIDNI